MNANKLAQQNNYFQNGYYDGSNNYRARPQGCSAAQEGSAAWESYLDGYAEGKRDGGH